MSTCRSPAHRGHAQKIAAANAFFTAVQIDSSEDFG
jgi:hypothetical protein